MIKAVIFDLNGIFIQSDLLSDRIEKDFGIPADKFISVLKEVKPRLREPEAPAAFSLFRPRLKAIGLGLSEKEFLDYWFSGEHVDQNMIELAKNLREKQIKVFLLSNNFRERAEFYRQNFPEIFANSDGTYFSWETGFTKPDPRAWQNILSEHNLRPEECVFIDDKQENLDTAKNLGLTTCHDIAELKALLNA